jgi:uncharacterized protein YggE
MPTEITVRGRSNASEPPERGTVHATIAFEGPAMEPVYERVARDMDSVKASVESLRAADGPVTRWSAQALRTWSSRPWNQEGKRLPTVYHARVDVEVEFRDFTALSRWITAHTNDTEGVRISDVEWSLTTGRGDELRRQVRTKAVEDAVRRAQQYADALDLGEVRPVAVADSGMLSAGPTPGGGDDVGLMRSMAVGSAPEMELVPEDIEVSATVDARFVAG